MGITWKELLIGFDEDQSDALLEDWRWLMGDDLQPIAVSALGDLFLDNADGFRDLTEAGCADFEPKNMPIDEFNQLRQQTVHAEEWFAPGQCYSYNLPPMLNGAVEVDNIAPADLLVHCTMFG